MLTAHGRTIGLLALLGAAGCVPRVPLQYDVGLSEVRRPTVTAQRYGPYTISPVADSGYRFQDSLVTVLFYVEGTGVGFSLENHTDHSLHLIWDEAAFVDLDGVSHQVMHSGIRYSDCSASKAPSVVPSKGRLVDVVVPCGFVSSVTSALAGAPRVIDFLPRIQVSVATSDAEATEIAKPHLGRTFRILLPVRVENVINEYTFTFRILGAWVPELAPYLPPE